MIYYLYLFAAVILMALQFTVNKFYQSKNGSGIQTSLLYTTLSGFATGLIFLCINGFSLNVEASFNLNIDNDRGTVELFGTKAGVNTDNCDLYTTVAGKYVKVVPDGENGFDFDAFQREVAAFVNASAGNEPCRATADDGTWLMKILDAIYESARIGKSVEITPIKEI